MRGIADYDRPACGKGDEVIAASVATAIEHTDTKLRSARIERALFSPRCNYLYLRRAV